PEDTSNIEGPFVTGSVMVGTSQEVLRLAVDSGWQPGDPVFEVNPRFLSDPAARGWRRTSRPPDPLISPWAPSAAERTPAFILSFNGIGFGGSVPPDPIGDVGPNHYVQMVNTRFAIFDKMGVMLSGPTS